MDIQVIEAKNNTILNRRELVFKVIHDESTPTRKSVVERLAATQNSKIGLIYVDSLKTEFGKQIKVDLLFKPNGDPGRRLYQAL